VSQARRIPWANKDTPWERSREGRTAAASRDLLARGEKRDGNYPRERGAQARREATRRVY